MSFFDGATLDVFLADFGLPCTSGAVSFLGIFDQPTLDFQIGQAGILSDEYQLVARTDQLNAAGITTSSPIMVEGVSYFAREVMQLDDGAFSRVLMTKV